MKRKTHQRIYVGSQAFNPKIVTSRATGQSLTIFGLINEVHEMASSDWHLSLKLMDQPKSIFYFPEMMPGDVPPGGYRVAALKQLVAAQLSESIPDPELIDIVHCGRKLKDDLTLDACGIHPGSTLHILKKAWPEPESSPEPVNKANAAREFRVFHAALHSLNSSYRDSVYKLLTNKESLDQIIIATPGLKSDPVALGVLQDKDLFVQFTDPNMLDVLSSSHPALVNAIILVLHSVAGSMPSQSSASSSRNVSSSSYSDMPGGFMFEGMSDDEDDFQSGSPAGPSSRGPPSGIRPVSLSHSGATGPRPITQSELATALALASTPDSSAVTPTTTSQVDPSGAAPMSAGTPVSNDLFSQALQQALQATNMSALQGRWQSQMQQLRDMGIQDEELMLRALQATDGDIQAALELIFAGGLGL
ncbi:ubiquitin-like protein 7 isoform X1 [Cynoglossus semilaevis]|uniref:Ubiquitin-like protein 7 n=1 Tax=Cynoglossus semilaevis TaxID=244447 RepID=A0A3P8W124_CYNSE|nr:ubiquitin-like protein 7 isoform X1 [Cynoglossus semilaevis]